MAGLEKDSKGRIKRRQVKMKRATPEEAARNRRMAVEDLAIGGIGMGVGTLLKHGGKALHNVYKAKRAKAAAKPKTTRQAKKEAKRNINPKTGKPYANAGARKTAETARKTRRVNTAKKTGKTAAVVGASAGAGYMAGRGSKSGGAQAAPTTNAPPKKKTVAKKKVAPKAKKSGVQLMSPQAAKIVREARMKKAVEDGRKKQKAKKRMTSSSFDPHNYERGPKKGRQTRRYGK